MLTKLEILAAECKPAKARHTGVYEIVFARDLMNSLGLGPCMSPNHINVYALVTSTAPNVEPNAQAADHEIEISTVG